MPARICPGHIERPEIKDQIFGGGGVSRVVDGGQDPEICDLLASGHLFASPLEWLCMDSHVHPQNNPIWVGVFNGVKLKVAEYSFQLDQQLFEHRAWFLDTSEHSAFGLGGTETSGRDIVQNLRDMLVSHTGCSEIAAKAPHRRPGIVGTGPERRNSRLRKD
ncbi:hypothetical protein B0H10DRAFT_1951411 [Mycena sp. CBHHK59/15]|nr:hypothetical protein B0H10DRAFT_1951411 [Mycena sp. CBHHK59/15]